MARSQERGAGGRRKSQEEQKAWVSPTSGLRAPETQPRPGGDGGAKEGRLERQDHKKGCQSPSTWLQEK